MTTRRSLLAGLALPAVAAACHPIVPASIPRHAEDHPDAELLRLVCAFEAANAQQEVAGETYRRVWAETEAMRPPKPDAMRRTGDFRFFWGRASNPHSPVFYTPAECIEFRTSVPVGHGHPDQVAACRARRDEIVAAFDTWSRDIKAHEDASGLTAVRSDCDEKIGAYLDILRRIEQVRPVTLGGFVAKARVALADDSEEFDRILRDDLLALAGGVA